MQTFLPFESFDDSLNLLDKRRLNKQNIESTQILNILLNRNNGKKGWKNHTATKLWEGYENALKLYKNIGMDIAIRKGIKYKKLFKEQIDTNDIVLPPIIGRTDFHESHLANLKRKIFEKDNQYNDELRDNMIAALGQYKFDNIDSSLPYIWK